MRAHDQVAALARATRSVPAAARSAAGASSICVRPGRPWRVPTASRMSTSSRPAARACGQASRYSSSSGVRVDRVRLQLARLRGRRPDCAPPSACAVHAEQVEPRCSGRARAPTGRPSSSFSACMACIAPSVAGHRAEHAGLGAVADQAVARRLGPEAAQARPVRRAAGRPATGLRTGRRWRRPRACRARTTASLTRNLAREVVACTRRRGRSRDEPVDEVAGVGALGDAPRTSTSGFSARSRAAATAAFDRPMSATP